MCLISAIACSKVHADKKESFPGGYAGARQAAVLCAGATLQQPLVLCLRLEQIKRFTCPSGFKVCLRCRAMQRNMRRKKIHLNNCQGGKK